MDNIGRRNIVFIMASVMVGLLVSSLDLTIVTTAMPEIVKSLDGFEYYTWPMVSFTMTMAISMPLFGKLADTYGFKPVYVFGVVSFLVSSILCGFSQDMIQLILFRGIQGIGGAILVANSLAVVGLLFPPASRTKYMGILGAGGIVASIAGPSVGGFITDHWSWVWIFYINVPVCLVALWLILMAKFPHNHNRKEKRNIDYFGVLILIAALIPLLLAFTWVGSRYAWSSIQIIALLGVSLVMTAVFAWVESKAREPIVPLSLFRKSIFNFSALEMFLINGILLGVLTFVPLFMQNVMGHSVSESGTIITPMMVSMIMSMIFGGVLVSKLKRYKIQAAVGIAIMMIGCGMLLLLESNSSSLQVIMDMIVIGIGAGLSLPIFTAVAQSGFSKSQTGVVTSNVQFFKTLGQTIAPALLGTVMNRSLIGQVTPDIMGAIHNVFMICIVVLAIALVASIIMKEFPLEKAI